MWQAFRLSCSDCLFYDAEAGIWQTTSASRLSMNGSEMGSGSVLASAKPSEHHADSGPPHRNPETSKQCTSSANHRKSSNNTAAPTLRPEEQTKGYLASSWHAHLDPLDPQTPYKLRNQDEVAGWEVFQRIKKAVYIHLNSGLLSNTSPNLQRPRPVPWYHPKLLPSPVAFYSWRRENAKMCNVEIGSCAETLFYKYLVQLNYDPSLQQHIITDQDALEQRFAREFGPSSPHARPHKHHPMPLTPHCFLGVVEAQVDPSVPSVLTCPQQLSEESWSKVATAARNRKAFPLNFYLERSRFQNDWADWCRLNGSNDQNHLFDCAHFASHNSFSLYHKVKYGDWGSPHPYVPFAITNPEEFAKSRSEQVQQELDAIKWIQERRSAASTQEQLSQVGDIMRQTEAHVNGSSREQHAPEAQSLNVIHPDPAKSPVALVPVHDDVVVDQETEQPQALGQQHATEAISGFEEVETQKSTQTEPAPVAPSNNTVVQEAAKNNVPFATSVSNPITVSVIVPENLMPWIRREVYQCVREDHPDKLAYWLDSAHRRLPWPREDKMSRTPFVRLRPTINVAAVVTDDELPWRNGENTSFRYPGDDGWAADHNLTGSHPGPRWSSLSRGVEPPPSFQIGNLYLSSCPGKKVRLSGAVRGRGAVCRDLGLDLKRFQELGVGTLVCCLSDVELAAIGVEWQQYLHEADRLGLDLIRVPMVEGNCPTSLEILDTWLNEIIEHCTLKGVNVLIHCRGGVGRAGTVAACWLIKMGFVDEYRSEAEKRHRGHVWPSQEIMWQCLQIVRLRRSSKAIETAEQASFVAQYGQYVLDQWHSQNPAGDALGKKHCQTIDDFWQRMRIEAQLWAEQQNMQQQQQQQQNNENQQQADTSQASQPLSSTPIGSNIKTRHAAQIKPQPASVNGHGDCASTQSDSQSAAGSSQAAAVVSTGVIPASPTRGDGEPSRKRRNTLSTMAGIHLDDNYEDSTPALSQSTQIAELASRHDMAVPQGGAELSPTLSVSTAASSDTGSSPASSLSSIPQQRAKVGEEDELDAFPVMGRNEVAQQPSQ